MSTIANRRELAEAVQALVKTNKPSVEHYDRVLNALSVVASDDFGFAIKVDMRYVGDTPNKVRA